VRLSGARRGKEGQEGLKMLLSVCIDSLYIALLLPVSSYTQFISSNRDVYGSNHVNVSAVSKLVTTIECSSHYNLHLILAV
jgi:hypothetical protein